MLSSLLRAAHLPCAPDLVMAWLFRTAGPTCPSSRASKGILDSTGTEIGPSAEPCDSFSLCSLRQSLYSYSHSSCIACVQSTQCKRDCFGVLCSRTPLLLQETLIGIQVSPGFFEAPGAAMAQFPGSKAQRDLHTSVTIVFCSCCSYKVG